MKKTTVTELKHYLKQHSKEELIKEIADLFAKFDYVKDYYETKIHPENTEPVLKKYKKTIKDEFFPSRGFGKLRASVVKKAIPDKITSLQYSTF